jgi:hypothetical protein
MRGRGYAPVMATALVAVALAGCGGGGSSSTVKSTSTSSTTPPANIEAAVTECRELVAKQSKLPAAAKEKLEDACDKAGKGDSNAVKRVAQEVCVELVSRASLPASARATALAACQK